MSLLLEKENDLNNFFAQLVRMKFIEEKAANDIKLGLIKAELFKNKEWTNDVDVAATLDALIKLKLTVLNFASWYDEVLAKDATAFTNAKENIEKNVAEYSKLRDKFSNLQNRYLFTANYTSILISALCIIASCLIALFVPGIAPFAGLVVLAGALTSFVIVTFLNRLINNHYQPKLNPMSVALSVLETEYTEQSKLLVVNDIQNELQIEDMTAELQVVIATLDANIKAYEVVTAEVSAANDESVAVVPTASDTASAAVVANVGLFAVKASDDEKKENDVAAVNDTGADIFSNPAFI